MYSVVPDFSMPFFSYSWTRRTFSVILPRQQRSLGQIEPIIEGPAVSCWWHWLFVKCHSRRRCKYQSQADTVALKVHGPCNARLLVHPCRQKFDRELQ